MAVKSHESEYTYKHFDVWAEIKMARKLSNFIKDLAENTMICVASCDEVAKNLKEYSEAFESLGVNTGVISYRGSVVFVARKGSKRHTKQQTKVTYEGPAHLSDTVVIYPVKQTGKFYFYLFDVQCYS